VVRAGCGAAGRSAVAPFVRPSRVWLRSCYPPRMRLSPLLRTLAFCILAACGESPSLPAADAATSDSAADLCLSQCELAAGRCEERPLSAFGNLEATRTEWLTRCPANPTQRPFVLEGRCGDGTLLLHQGATTRASGGTSRVTARSARSRRVPTSRGTHVGAEGTGRSGLSAKRPR
jgi:hypothetical protein